MKAISRPVSEGSQTFGHLIVQAYKGAGRPIGMFRTSMRQSAPLKRTQVLLTGCSALTWMACGKLFPEIWSSQANRITISARLFPTGPVWTVESATQSSGRHPARFLRLVALAPREIVFAIMASAFLSSPNSIRKKSSSARALWCACLSKSLF